MSEDEGFYINPFTDFGAKYLLGIPKHKHFLIDFLNSVVLPPELQINDLIYINTELTPNYKKGRRAIFDVRCKATGDQMVSMEVQGYPQNNYLDRSVFYAATAVVEQSKQGRWDFKLPIIYMVSILNFLLDTDDEREDAILHLQIKDQNGEVSYKKLTFVLVQIPNFRLKLHELKTKADKWLFILREMATAKSRIMGVYGQIYNEFLTTAELAKLSIKERARYEMSLKGLRDEYNQRKYAVERASKQSLQQGLEQGLERSCVGFFDIGVEVPIIARGQQISEEKVIAILQKHGRM